MYCSKHLNGFEYRAKEWKSYKDKQGHSKSVTDWHTINLRRGAADLAVKYVRKGSILYVEGNLKTRSYNDKEGNKRNVTEVIAEQVILLDKKAEGE